MKPKKPAEFWERREPIQLREMLLAHGVPQRAIARELINPATGKHISFPYFNGVLVTGNIPRGWPSPEAFKADVEAVLDGFGLPKAGIWEPIQAELPNNRQPYQGRRHHWIDKYQKGVEEVNVTKILLPREALSHFGLREDPFYELENFNRIWLAPAHQNISDAIQGAVQRRSLLAVHGDIGSGKSSLLRHTCLAMMKNPNVKLIWPDCLNRNEMDGDALVNRILRGLGREKLPPSREAKKAAASEALQDAVTAGEHVALIIDEAHDLPEAVLVALKRLWDSAMLFKLLGIVIVGQGGIKPDGLYWGLPGLILGSPRLREFAERALMIGMPSAKAKDLADYLGWRFKRAGGDVGQVLEPAAINALAKRTDCLQMANNYCARAMLATWQIGEKMVTAEAMASV